MCRLTLTLKCLMIVLALYVPIRLSAQEYTYGPLKIAGSAGFTTELYGVSGIGSRRPPASGRLFANLTAEGAGFRYGLDMNLSTEQSSIRQNLNQLGLNVSYRWLTIAAGDVRPVFSPFSLNGQNIRGASLETTPGKMFFSVTGGRSRRAVKPTDERFRLTPGFDRWYYATKIGYEHSLTDYFYVIGTYGRDAAGSLKPSLRNEFNLIPAENSTLSTEFGKRFWGDRFNLDGTFTWSTHNGNTSLGSDGSISSSGLFPGFDDGAGTFSDYAGRVNLRFSQSNFSLGTTYERVQPGFISMGLPYLRNDQEQIRFTPQIQLFDRKVRLGLEYSHIRNNLEGQLLNTNSRHLAGINTQARITERFSMGGAYRIMLNYIIPEESIRDFDNRQMTHTVTFTPVYKWDQNGLSHNIQLSSNIQLFTLDRFVNDEKLKSDFKNLTNSLNYSLLLGSGLSFSPGLTHVVSRTDQSNLNAFRSQLSVSKGFFNRLVVLSTGTSYTNNRTTFGSGVDRPKAKTEQFSLNITAGYRLPIGDYLRLNIRGLRNSSSTGTDFSEIQARLQLKHRF